MFIPVFTKYIWSATKPVGTLIEGGMFSGSEIVVQSGTTPVGQWVEEQVNVYEDFTRIHEHEPAAKAWRISIVAGAGAEVDCGPMVATSDKHVMDSPVGVGPGHRRLALAFGLAVMGAVGAMIGIIMGGGLMPVAILVGLAMGGVIGFLGGRRFLVSILIGSVLGGALAWLVAGTERISVGAG